MRRKYPHVPPANINLLAALAARKRASPEEIESALRTDGQIVIDEQGLSHVAAFFDLPKEGRAGFFKLCTARDSYESMYLRVRLYKDRDCKKLMWDGCELQEGVATCLACLSRYVE